MVVHASKRRKAMLIRWPEHTHRRPARTLFDEMHRELDRAFKGWTPLFQHAETTGRFPRINLLEREDHFCLIAEVPGLTKEDITLEANADGITLAGTRSVNAPEDATIYRQERTAFEMKRHFRWPSPVDLDQIEASLKDGMLHVTIGKTPETQPRNIDIKAL
jgi:HSP20 family protein